VLFAVSHHKNPPVHRNARGGKLSAGQYSTKANERDHGPDPSRGRFRGTSVARANPQPQFTPVCV
jgi:hypothetical protein